MDKLGSKLKSLRGKMGLSLKQLAERTECSPSYLSMVENSKVDPSISRLKRIAEGLGLTIVDLFQAEIHKDIIIRKDDRLRARFPQSKTTIEILVPHLAEKQMDARLATVHPGGDSKGYYRHPGEEFGLVLEGTLELAIDGVKYQLNEGDSFYFSSTRNHRFRNPGNKDTVVVWVNHPPSF